MNVYIYLVFVGNGWLALVPSHLPHLRELSLEFCRNVCDKYIKELVAAVPGLVVIKPWDVNLDQWETNMWKILKSAALQMWMVSSRIGHCQINQNTVTLIIRKSQKYTFLWQKMHKTCFFLNLSLQCQRMSLIIVAVYCWVS